MMGICSHPDGGVMAVEDGKVKRTLADGTVEVLADLAHAQAEDAAPLHEETTGADEAVEAYHADISRNPDDKIPRGNLGNLLRQRGDFDGAERQFREISRIDPMDEHAFCSIGALRAERRDFAGAEAAYRSALHCNPNSEDTLFNMGNLFDRKQDHAAAIEWWRDVLSINPDHAPAHNNIARALVNGLKPPDVKGALFEFREALRCGIEEPWASEARDNIRALVRVVPGEAAEGAPPPPPGPADDEKRALMHQCKDEGTKLFQAQSYRAAVTQYDTALSHAARLLSNPEHSSEARATRLALHLNVAACFLKVDEHKLAIASCDKALLLDGECAKAMYRRAAARSALGGSELEAAKADLERAAALAPDDSAVQKLLVRVTEQRKRQEAKERALWKKAFA